MSWGRAWMRLLSIICVFVWGNTTSVVFLVIFLGNATDTTDTPTVVTRQPPDPTCAGLDCAAVQFDSKFPDPFDCYIYHECKNGTYFGHACPEGTLYDQTSFSCVPFEQTLGQCDINTGARMQVPPTCPRSPDDEGISAFVPHPVACHLWFSCTGGQVQVINRCPPSLYSNEMGCKDPSEVSDCDRCGIRKRGNCFFVLFCFNLFKRIDQYPKVVCKNSKS